MANQSLPRKSEFHLPDGMIYLDGNSLGPLPRSVADHVNRVIVDEWGQDLITSWNKHHWMDKPNLLGDKIARLIGAAAGSVVLGDTLSIKVFQALSAALDLRPDRRIILSDIGNFPSDLYMAEGLIALKSAGYRLRCVPSDQILSAIDDTVAAVLLTEVDYRTGARYDMQQITAKAHDMGAVMIWDLAHSAGAVDLDLAATGCEFAVGCTYKYLNAGPGAPAFIYARPDLADQIAPALSGWLGHDAPFAFDPTYRPAPGVARLRVGTPAILQMAALEAALAVWDTVDMADIRRASIELSELFIDKVLTACPDLTLISPRNPAQRGSHVSFGFDHGYAVIQALIARGVVGDFRAPDVMRFGITPLYLDAEEVEQAATILGEIMSSRAWDQIAYHKVQNVT